MTHGQVKVAVVSTIYLKILRKKDKKKKDPKERRMEHGWAWLGGGGGVKHPEEDGKEATSVWRFGI